MKQEIEKEITKLKTFKSKFNLKHADKSDARKLLSEINTFNRLFKSEYTYAQPFYSKSTYAKTDIDDGIEDLERYIESKLKEKDDKYCVRGFEKIYSSLNSIISSLEDKIKPKED